tara:strand:- start:1150 stop:1614 length:465 start_codon:yes stop_codon:yes gene_type:complete
MGWDIVAGSEVGKWVADKTTELYNVDSAAIGLQKDNKITAGVVYQDYCETTIVCHIRIEGRVNKQFLKAIFNYPFDQLEVEKIIVPITEENEKSIHLVKNMGFKEEARISRSNGDIVFFTLHKNDCKFLGERYGKSSQSTTSTRLSSSSQATRH